MIRHGLRPTLLVLLATAVSHPFFADGKQAKAFPGAEGFGASATGGRGGRVLLVTSLRDYARGRKPVPGTLRAAIETKGPRIVVFRVSGTIALVDKLVIGNPDITIAGQSAPGGGICLKDRSVIIAAPNVVVRHLRVRPGDEPVSEFRERGKRFEPDAISINQGARNIIVDHCSASWAIDEVLSVSGKGITDVTVQWCIISESLNQSAHSKGKHGYGSLLRCNGNITFHHNLYTQHSSRCPRPGTYGDGSILLDFRNNVIHNGKGYSGADAVRMNYVGNHIRTSQGAGFYVGGAETKVFVDRNFQVGLGRKNESQWKLIGKAKPTNKRSKPFPAVSVRTTSAQDAFQAVLASAGATLPRRDAVDRRLVTDVQKGKMSLIDSQEDVGGWPRLSTTSPRRDSDSDGMPDKWETMFGLSLGKDDSSGDPDGDGYTNIEEFLNATDPKQAVDRR